MISNPRFIQRKSSCRLVQRRALGDQKSQLLSMAAHQLGCPGYVPLVGQGHRGDQAKVLPEKTGKECKIYGG